MKIAKLNIEGYIGGSDIQAMFSGEETFNLSKLKKFLDSLETDVTDIHVYINSGGGSVTEGWAIYDKLKASGKSITTIGEGIVGSIATIIYMAGSTRKLHENSKFFIHNPYWQANAEMPMEGNDLIALGEDLINEQNKILSFYSNSTGTGLNSIEPLMNKATDLTATQAVEMGFAHSIINEFVNQNHYRLVAMIDIKDKSNKQINKMEEQNNAVLSAIEKFGTMLNKFIKGKTLNMKIQATNSAGEQVELVVDGEGEAIVGAPAFTVDVNGEQMPAMDGSYTDTDGKTFVVVEGKIAEIIEANKPEPIEAIKAELETVKAQLVEKESMLQASITEKESIKASLDGINTEFVALKATVIGASAKFEKGSQEFNNQKQQETSHNSEFINQIKNSLTKK